MSSYVIFKNVTKKYKMYDNPKDKLKGVFLPENAGEDFFALQHVSFTAKKGDVIGVIGVNGAGKSTLSNLIAGITPPTSGEIKLDGQASLIAINSGLDGQLTGRENIELKCLMLGFSKKETKALMPDIEEFADIGKFIDQPVKNYSSGMKSRLGFAISINIDPDILVVDEALSVGDQTFANKCLDKMNEFKEKGKTIFFISHSIGQIKKFCQKALWLEAGMVKAYGTIEEVVPEYQSFLKEYKAMSKEEKLRFKEMVNEKRSKLADQSVITERNKKDKTLTTLTSRVTRSNIKSLKKRIKYFFVTLLILVVGAGLFTGYKFNLVDRFFADTANKTEPNKIQNTGKSNNNPVVSSDNPNRGNDNQLVNKNDVDVRYVNVRSAYIRAEHDLNSEPTSVTGFGSPYKVSESYQDEENDIKWLQVTSMDSDEATGWISSKLLTSIDDKSSDVSLIDSLEELLGIDLNNQTEILGQSKETIETVDRDHTVKDGNITSVTLHTNPAGKDMITEQLGEPQLKSENALMYSGDKYYYVIDLSENVNAESITIGIQDNSEY